MLLVPSRLPMQGQAKRLFGALDATRLQVAHRKGCMIVYGRDTLQVTAEGSLTLKEDGWLPSHPGLTKNEELAGCLPG